MNITRFAIFFLGTLGAFTTPNHGLANSVSAVLSDNCIVTAGRAFPSNSILSKTVGLVEAEADADTDNQADDQKLDKSGSAILAALGVELVKSVVTLGVEKTTEYVKKRSQDSRYSYDQTISTYLLELASPRQVSASDKKIKLAYDLSLNQLLNCITIVTSPNPLLLSEGFERSTPKQDTWDDANWEFDGLADATLISRLEAGGFNLKGKLPLTVFEARWDYSTEGDAARLVPLYYMAWGFEGNDGKSLKVAKRNVAYSVTISKPGNDSSAQKIVQKTLDLGAVQTEENGNASIAGTWVALDGFGPTAMAEIAPNAGWIDFNLTSYSPGTRMQKLLNQTKPGIDFPIGVVPVNISIKVIEVEEAPEFYKFLAKFIEDQSVEEKLTSAVLSELIPTSDEEKLEEAIGEIDKRITIVTAHRSFYISSQKELLGDEFNEALDETIQEYDKEVLGLEAQKLVLEYGCDPITTLSLPGC